MSSQVYVLSESQATANQVMATLQELEVELDVRRVESSAQLRLELDSGTETDLVLIDESVEGSSGIDVARELTTRNPLTAVLLMTHVVDERVLAAALEAGTRGILEMPPSIDQFSERVDSTLAWVHGVRKAAATEDEPVGTAGKVITFVGAKGGVGTTTLAVTAARIASSRVNVCLVDLDVRAGDVAPYCGITVRRNITDLVEVTEELTRRSLGEVTYPAAARLSLLPAPADGEDGELLTEAATRQILTALRYQYDLVIIDAGSRLDEIQVQALDLADDVYVVATPDVPAMRAVRRFLETSQRLGIDIDSVAHLLLNQAERDREIQPNTAGSLADLSLDFSVPALRKDLDPVMNAATLLSHPPEQLDKAMMPVTASFPEPLPLEPAAAEPAAAPLRRRRSTRRVKEAGQIAVEFPGVIALVLAVGFIALQMVLWGYSFLFANGAARDAARAYGVGSSQIEVRRVVTDALPATLSGGARVARHGDIATVTVPTPSLSFMPEVEASSTIYWER